MRETRQSGSEGGGALIRSPYLYRNRFGGGEQKDDGRSTALFVGRCEWWLPGRLDRRSLRSDSIFVAGACMNGSKGFGFGSQRSHGPVGRSGEEKWKSLRRNAKHAS